MNIPLTLIDMIVHYQLSFDSIAYAIEYELPSHYPPLPSAALLLSTTSPVVEFDTDTNDKMYSLNDPNGVVVRLSRLSSNYWWYGHEYDDESIRDRVYYKLGCLSTFGSHVHLADYDLAYEYSKRSKKPWIYTCIRTTGTIRYLRLGYSSTYCCT
jgi:hypothetical protein